MAAAPDRKPLGTNIWTCYSGFLTCQHDHLLRYANSGFRANMDRMSGHAFMACTDCDPPTYFLAVFATTPDPHATCYAINRESFRHWDTHPEDTPPTPELLHILRDPDGKSYNPYWRPPRPREKR